MADGTISKGGFGDPEAVIAAGAEAVIPKAIERMLLAADSSPSQEVYADYEPSGLTGFSELSVNKFLAATKVSATDFAHFRKVYAQERYGTWRSDDPVVKAVYPQWVAFNTKQSAEYVAAIARAFKEKRPAARFWITQRSCTGADDLKTLAIGNDNAAMADSLDGVLPQVYYGYGAAAAKRTALVVEEWRRTVDRLNPDCRLVPLLLNRYAGASVKNTPEMVRLQGLASVASGADGVSYYFVQHFDGEYYPHLLRMRQEMARYENFYVDGQRVDNLFELAGMGESKASMQSWPGVELKVQNPGWHMTAHQLGTKILLTLFNFDKDNELLFQENTKANFVAAENCAWKNGQVLLTTAEAAFLVFEL
jgi:beta-galactosidase GanA